ncbi:SARP family transcriptional regulator [Virgisporangium aurantiacum]|uniref:SARP family transcriptional regulator n=1 Tax=Virgisporangium aurantiacum TaxID=175570 RepID=A0A8J3ZJJ2_9ACTN|nr:SARP family transcriptional regulator [Virgisporangium aurantiacum]
MQKPPGVTVKYGVLGPLSVCSDDGVEVPLRSRLERTLLAALLVRAGQVVTVGQLVETLWADRPPSSYASNLQTYISRLRDRLTRTTIEHANGGYRLTVPDEDLDLARFRQEAKAAHAESGEQAVERFRAALKEWRGPMLAGMSIPLLASDIAHCDLERLDAAEDCADAHLAAGLPVTNLLPELRQLIAEHPLRERLHGLLMRALCRAGRRADALLAYQHARDLLVNELGIEPGAALQRLHQAILKGEDDEPAPTNTFPVCQLPPTPAGFVGRQQEISRIARLLRPGAIVPVVALSGQPGVGKSTAAVVAAHTIRDAFPDGQIFINLAGASAAPRDAAGALADILRSLGVPGPAIPDDLGALTATYRAKLADRRVLVLLDDAADPAQIRPLIPGTGGSAVLVTSRRLLGGLVEARHVHLDPLTDPEAQELLAHMVGAERMARSPAFAARIADACGNLPLALRIAGIRLATRGLTVEALAERLGDERRRLGELMVGDQQVRASIAFSVAALSPQARAAFAALGPVGPRSVAAWLVSMLVDATSSDAVVEELVEAGLLTPDGAGPDGEPRYRLHDLLRLYAEDLPNDDPAARARVVTAVLWASDIASRNLPRTVTWARAATTAGPARLPDGLAERLRAAPGEWLDAEVDLLVDFVLQVADDDAALALAERLAPFLWARGSWTRLREVLAVAGRAATRAGDRRGLAWADLINGILRLVRGEVAAAAEHFARSLSRYERLGDAHGLACVLSDQAVLYGYQEYAERAIAAAERAREHFAAADDPLGAVIAAPALSAALRGLGRFPAALEVDRRAVAQARVLDAADIVLGRCLNSLTVSELLSGAAAQAHDAATEAVRLLRPTGDRYVYLAALRQLATAAAGLRRRTEAIRLLRESRDLATELGDLLGRTSLDRDLAVSRIGDGDPASAATGLERCLVEFERMDIPSGQATTLTMLARAYDELGKGTEARNARRRLNEVRRDPRDLRTPMLTEIMMQLAERV